LRDVILVATGGAIGAVARYAVGRAGSAWLPVGFPWATFAINVGGCFLMGIVAGFAGRGAVSPEARLFLATGVLGGFTTFSAFGLEAQSLIAEGRVGAAAAYTGGHLLLGIAGVFAGLAVARRMI
jgi:CrcB protein